MKPIEEQKTITVYRCTDCNSEHGLQQNAEACCGCNECGGPTTAEMRNERSEPGGYDVRRLCSWCRLRLWIKRQQDRVRYNGTHVESAKRDLAQREKELERSQKELADLIAKRDALPPKPRQPKPKKEEAP
jgi:hypothetical protein